MAYFNELPNISYVSRIKNASRNDERLEVKNLFKRAKLRDDIESAVTAFEFYEIPEGMRPDVLAEKLYGDPELDWVVLIANNITNVKDQWPLDNNSFHNYLIDKYGSEEALEEIHHYETLEVRDEFNRVVLDEGIVVDEDFYNAPIYSEDTTSTFLPVNYEGRVATGTVRSNVKIFRSIQLIDSGSGYETSPEVEIIGTGSGASATANLSETGYVKRIEITNPGSGYELPPVITFGGGLEGQSGTAEIINGQITNIELDGVKFDTTNQDQIYEFGPGTNIVPNGSGLFTLGGFNVGSTHLRFGGLVVGSYTGERYVILNPINATAINTVRVYAVRGNGLNGGETPDINGVEDLYIQYQITDVGVEPDPDGWENLGIVIDAVPNGSGTGVLDNYDFDLTGTPVQAEHVYFRLYQPASSGDNYDHYGVLSVTFIGDASVLIPDATVTIEKNPLQSTPLIQDATASVITGKTIESITVDDAGSGYDTSTLISLNGGNFQEQAFATAGYESVLQVQITDPGEGYESAYALFSGGGGGTGLTVDVIVSDSGTVEDVVVTNQGIGYVSDPIITFSDPNGPEINIIAEGETFPPGEDTWKYNGEVWEKKTYDTFKYRDVSGNLISLNGNQISRPVSNYEYETRLNQKKMRIKVLKKSFLPVIISDMRNIMKYDESSQYETQILKKSYNPRITGI